jgi:hypothetical protein
LKSISLAPGRNYFVTSDATADHTLTNVSAFYTVAAESDDRKSQLILTGTDGIARLVADNRSTTNISVNWGDEISSVSLPCGADWYVLADAPGDWLKTDRLQLFRISAANAAPAGHPLDLPGPVVALWPSNGGDSVRVISRNLETGMYETSMVSASCGN